MSPHAQVSPNSTLTDSFCPNSHTQSLPQLHLHQTDWPQPTPAEVTRNKIHQALGSPPCTQVLLHKLLQTLVSWLCSRKSQLVCCQRFQGVWPNKIWPAEKAEVAKLYASSWEANVWAESTGIFNRCCPWQGTLSSQEWLNVYNTILDKSLALNRTFQINTQVKQIQLNK